MRGRTGSAKIGIFAEGSHRVVDIPRCEIHDPLINDVARALKTAVRKLGLTCYDDVHHRGLVRSLQVVVERPTRTAQVVVVCNDTTAAAALPLFTELQSLLGTKLHSSWWNGNPDVTNRVLGPSFQRISGPECSIENLGGAQVFFPPGAFGQNNLEMFDRIVAAIQRAVPPDRDVVELFAGTGGIGLGLAARSRSIVFNEIGPESLAGLEYGIAALGPATAARTRVVRGPAHIASNAITRESIVIADPPRKGLGPELLGVLEARGPERLIYLSCGLGSFIRDTQTLTQRMFRLDSATAYDVFPYTDHVETLAHFSRAAP